MNPGRIPWPLAVPLLVLAWLVSPALLLLAWVGWLIQRAARPSEVKRAERAERQRSRQRSANRIGLAIQAQLIAHRLPDTPANRARMLQALSQGKGR